MHAPTWMPQDPPYLIDGLKFDIRLYVLVTSIQPLRVYLHDEGLARFATERYDLTDLRRRNAHLTNYSLNKKSSEFVPPTEGENDGGSASKWSLEALRRRLETELGSERAQETWRRIDDLVVKTILSAEPALRRAASSHVAAAARGEPVTSYFQLVRLLRRIKALARCCCLAFLCPHAPCPQRHGVVQRRL